VDIYWQKASNYKCFVRESSQLQDQLKLIWTGFATRTSQSIRDVLSVSDLGHVLHQLIGLSQTIKSYKHFYP